MVSIRFAVFFNAAAPTAIYTLSLHDALPISGKRCKQRGEPALRMCVAKHGHPEGQEWAVARCADLTAGNLRQPATGLLDRKSTRLNSSHVEISYAVFCLKKKIHNKKNYKSHT